MRVSLGNFNFYKAAFMNDIEKIPADPCYSQISNSVHKQYYFCLK